MNKVSNKDIYEVKVRGMVSDVDKQTLIKLYQPLIGAQSVALFLTLLEDPSQKENTTSNFETLSITTGLTLGELFGAFQALEATGLVKSFYQGNNDISYYIFELFSPLTASGFFADVLLAGTLNKQIGNKNFKRLMNDYKLIDETKGMSDCSTTFNNYFSPNFANSDCYKINSFKTKGRISGNVKTDFDVTGMIRLLEEIGIKKADFSENELLIIEKLATLYAIDESQMSSLVSINFDQFATLGSRVNVNKLENSVRNTFSSAYRLSKPVETTKENISATFGESLTAQKIRMMESNSPSEYLALVSGGHKPAAADLKIVEDLALDFGLSFPVINALVDYVLLTNNNLLSRAYIEKIAAALAREGSKTAIDTMDYLTKVNSTFKNKKTSSSKIKKEPIKDSFKEDEETEDQYSDEDIDNLLNSLSKGK